MKTIQEQLIDLEESLVNDMNEWDIDYVDRQSIFSLKRYIDGRFELLEQVRNKLVK